MTEYAAYDSELKIGTQQSTYAIVATVAAALTASGNGTFSITAALLAGGVEQDYTIAFLDEDTPAMVVEKAVTALNLEVDLIPLMVFHSRGVNLYARMIEAADNDAAFNIAYADDDVIGLDADNSSEIGAGGVAEAAVAQVTNISGPGMGVDTEDVTTHDQATAWEESVTTIIRSGEVSLDIVYDPAHATHDAGTGLLYRMEDKVYSFFKLIFPSNIEWEFSGYVTGFEPGIPADGALTATVKAKITSQPLLA